MIWPLAPLPIDPVLPRIVAALERERALVIVAEPGAGKTTRVPRALLDAGWGERGEVLVLEPRRLAARLAAARVAAELGETPGGRVGYQVRFEERAGPATRIRFVTEGILARRLAAGAGLDGVAAVILDEFHERSLDGDLVLGLVREAQATTRPDLRVVVMSATLDAAPVAAFLGAEIERVAGRAHPVEIAWLERPDARPLDEQVRSGVRRALDEAPPGDVLVFLPGAAEIRRASQALEGLAADRDLAVVPLHGDLPAAEQDRAVRPAERRKVILATNVAETSVTIEGVTAVVDSGLFRRAGHSPWTGLPTLDTAPVSRAAAAQRAGRAGRTGPGACFRLYTRHDHDTRPAFEAPEVARADLAGAVLLLAGARPGGAEGFGWFEPPPPAALEAARELLARLGALDPKGAITSTGRTMLRLPAHPRAARLAVAAAERGAGRRGAALAALLGERDVRRAARTSFGKIGNGVPVPDLLERLSAFEEGGPDLDPVVARAAAQGRDQLVRALRLPPDTAPAGDEAPLLEALLAAFPDRVARRRAPGSAEFVFAGGGSGTLAAGSAAAGATFVVVTDARQGHGRVVIHGASAIEPEWLLDLFPERVTETTETVFDAEAERVVVVSRLVYDGLVLDETRRHDATGPEVSRALFDALQRKGPAALCDPDDLARWQQRLARAAEQGGEWPTHAGPDLDRVVAGLCEGRRSVREVKEAGLLDALRADLGAERAARLERLAPERVRLPGGRSVPVHYEPGKPPWIGSYLQDFFGMTETPRVGGAPVVVHLWAPSRRPVQVTTDLAGFWSRHYPALRTQLMRRYPRHAWPEFGDRHL